MATFSNRATLSYNGITTDSNTVTGEIIELVRAEKDALASTYRMGNDITYVISIVNGGVTAYSALTVSDDLGAFAFGEQMLVPLNYVDGSLRYYVNGVLQPTPSVSEGPPLVISDLTLPAGGNIIIIFRTTVNEFAPLGAGAFITNTATVTSASVGCSFTPVTASETVYAAEGALLCITKALSPTTVTECGEVTYTFTIQNSGNTPAVIGDNVTLSDTFTPILRDITVRLNGELLNEGTDYTYSEETGAFATVPGRITVPAATYSQSPTGEQIVTPGTTTLTVVGTI